MTCELEDTGGALDFQSLLSLFFPHTVFFFSFFMIFKFRKIMFHLENLNKEHLHVLDPDSPVFTLFVTFASLFSLLFWLAFSTHTHAHAHTYARAHTRTRTRGPHGFKDDSTVHRVHHSLFLRNTHAGISRGHVPRQDSRAGTVSRLFFGFARLPFMTSTTYLKNSGQLFLYMACLSPWVFQIFPCN